MISLLQYFVPLSSWCSFVMLHRFGGGQQASISNVYDFLLFMELYAFSLYFI